MAHEPPARREAPVKPAGQPPHLPAHIKLAHFIQRLLHLKRAEETATDIGPVLSDADRAAIARHIPALPQHPKIAVVMPVHNPNHDYLDQAIQSVKSQLYGNWELCIADDASTDRRVQPLLQRHAAEDARIKIVIRERNGHIAQATNSALALAAADYVAFMDQDDLLHETALYEIAHAVAAHPEARLIYSDEDRIDSRNRHSRAYHKPDFNIELLLGQNFLNHLTAYDARLVKALGGLRSAFDGSQDYDLALRAVAKLTPKEIVHVPAVLYHWRDAGRSSSFSRRHARKCADAALAAVQEFLDGQGEGARAVPIAEKLGGQYLRIIRKLPEPRPKVSVIIPTRNKPEVLSVCIDGLLNKTAYAEMEIIIVDNDSDEAGAIQLLAKLAQHPKITVLQHKGAFNYSTLNNRAVEQATGEVLALLNNDIEIIHPDWLAVMVAEAMRPDVGAVGAKLYYPDGRLQHAGITLGIHGHAGHAFHQARADASGYFGSTFLTRAFSAVTGACLVVKRERFLQVGGFEEKHLPVGFNDVDLCLKLLEAGYRNVWTPFARLIHHESLSRGSDDTLQKQLRARRELRYMRKRWMPAMLDDKFYNPNLSLQTCTYDAAPSRRRKPWAQYL